jgi:cobalt-zinc-cadmium efflux system membrane fusion protein
MNSSIPPSPSPSKKRTTVAVVTIAVTALLAVFVFKSKLGGGNAEAATVEAPKEPAAGGAPAAEATLELSANQLNAIKLETIGTYAFPVEKSAVGSIDFDEDLSVQVFTPYQGKIISALAQLGDDVQKGQALYTIESPDLIQAGSNLIGAAATLDLTNKELARAKELYSSKVGVSQRELEQATSDQQTAEGAFKAAVNAVRVFGKTQVEIDQMVATRKVDPALVVPSPISGQITYRNAQPGLFLQPGNPPAPYSVADVSIKWMLANVIESDAPLIHVGQPVEVTVTAYPGRSFSGKVSKVGAAIDPSTHRITIRASIADPKNELRSGMLANFIIRVEEPVEATAIPVNGVSREGDGTMTAWVTTDKHHFVQKKVTLGIQKDGKYQVVDGLQRGELAVADGAVFLSNMLEAPPSD